MGPSQADRPSPEEAPSLPAARKRPGRAAPATNPLLAPWPMPVVVVDTNVLLSSACHVAAHGGPAVLERLAFTGRAPLFIAPHVLDEVDMHLPRVAAQQHVSPIAARRALVDHLGPHLQVVDMTISDHLRPEVADIRRPDGDADDLPTAALAALLGPAVIISADGVFARFGLAVVGEWITAAWTLLHAAGFEASFADAVMIVDLLGRLVIAGSREVWRSVARYPVPALVTAAVVGVAGHQLGWASKEQLRRLGRFSKPLVEQLAVAASRHDRARRELLLVEDPTWREPTLTELLARHLARCRRPLTAAELRDALNLHPPASGRVTAAACVRAMANHPAFVTAPGGHFSVGRRAAI